MKIALIAAMSQNRVIGINNDLPWKLPDDMEFFMETTKGHIVVMGRKNFDSIPAKFCPLPDRTNVILTRQADYQAADCEVFNSLAEAYSFGRKCGEELLFVIGGGQIYNIAINHADELYLTEIHADIDDGEVFFPKLDDGWVEKSRVSHEADDRHKFSFDFVKYERAG